MLIQTIQTVLTWKTSEDIYTAKDLYKNTKFSLKLLLSTAYLEIVHAIFKLVPSNPLIVFPQVFIRWVIIFGIADNFTVSNKSIAIIALNFAWSLSEIIRYFCKLLNILKVNKNKFIESNFLRLCIQWSLYINMAKVQYFIIL